MHSKDRLPIFFIALDLRPYAKELRSRSPRGTDGQCGEGILRALLPAPLEHIQTFTGLHHHLETDPGSDTHVGCRLIERLRPSLY